jgi:alpha-1,3-rhamnosyl/mannosyltransferase
VFHATWNTGVPFRCPVPAVLTVHDVIPWDEPVCGFSTLAARTCYRYSLGTSVRRAQRVAAVSGFSADRIARKAGIDPSRMRVIYNGVEDAKATVAAAPRTERPYLLYVGGFEARKNLESVFRAMSRYWVQYDPAMELHLTGSPNQLSYVASQAYEPLGYDDRVRFLGSPGDDELAREYASATALLMLSRAEGFGLPVIEAMAYGCPVIAARCGALPEIVGDAGILVAPDDIERIVGSIHNIAHQPGLAGELIAQGRRRAEHFTWKRAAEAYLHEYQSAASNAVANPERAFPSTSSVAAGFR